MWTKSENLLKVHNNLPQLVEFILLIVRRNRFVFMILDLQKVIDKIKVWLEKYERFEFG